MVGQSIEKLLDCVEHIGRLSRCILLAVFRSEITKRPFMHIRKLLAAKQTGV